jgi:YbgC/YbaW family acyl-CoA thioester hydrolase
MWSMEIPQCTTHEEVMFFDTDCAGVVNNIAYLRMVETCRTRLGALMGMDFKSMETTQLYPAVLRTEIDYKVPAKIGDKLLIHGRLEKLERARFWCSFVMTREGGDIPLITCRQSLAMVQMMADKPGKPTRLPKIWAEQWGAALQAKP